MFIRFDYQCPTCGHKEERFVRREVMNEQYCQNHTDEAPARFLMLRLPAGTRTTFRFADTKLKG